MQEAKGMTEEAKRATQETTERARKVGQEYQRAAQSGFEAANRVLGEVNRGFQSVAAEMTNYTKKNIEDVFRALEQLASARSLPEVIDVQTRYAQKAVDNYMSQMSRLTELYLDVTRNASRPIEETGRQFH
jgi:phasin family protein